MTAANNYCVVQTTENNSTFLSVLPSQWVLKSGWKSYGPDDSDDDQNGDDLCYWPKGVSGYRLLEKAKKDPSIKPDLQVLRAFRCKIKRTTFASHSEAFRELRLMETNSDTEEYGAVKKIKKVSTAADLFNQIQQPKPGPSSESTASHQGSKAAKSSDAPFPKSGRRIQIGNGNQSPTSEQIQVPSVDDESAPNLLELVQSLHSKVEMNARIIEECKVIGNKSVALLSQVNAKLDVLANQVNLKLDNFVSQTQQTDSVRIDTVSSPLSPVKNLAEMESLEQKANSKKFVEAVIQYFGSMHGRSRYVGEGATVCLQLIDYFFDRAFLLNCSWTGTSRRKGNDENTGSKIAFHKFDGIITLFHKVIMFSDPTYPFIECQKFLKRCLRNSKQRFVETKGLKASVARNRRKRKLVTSSVDVGNNSQVEEEPDVIEEEEEEALDEVEDEALDEDEGGVKFEVQDDEEDNNTVFIAEYLVE
ncbi:uncharacterized protein LOC129753420 [Uranotaenia lowii]|uniref:uncharacterized protein LOC129753420 n=1 Tax=Uranotaenia lowii TaxID=190385 RepID=UPI002479C0E6|nr:uncharacterized protein LOC129753420 [Uranotaenia lowii]